MVLFPARDKINGPIVDAMRKVLDAKPYAVTELSTDDPDTFAAAFRAPRPFLLVDAHSWVQPGWVGLGWRDTPIPQLGARVLVLGCCKGAQQEIRRTLRAGLQRPTPVLACTVDEAKYSHGPALWPHVLERVPDLVATASDPDAACLILKEALAMAHWSDRRRRLEPKWMVDVLQPLGRPANTHM
ncbi:hypothetical protein [Mangrovactinospora gilvigrisea]|uniref:hypothetical protein n=1 Tax=Mangrovactinospora gilvigrisea TaxID=1428644 RepID=UPI001587523A|nr:hypothetical protein [Mangrovactinospora gilvigrisea]